jgi:myo-inositol-1(or 4)-monophosphatase
VHITQLESVLQRIETALAAAKDVVKDYTPGAVSVAYKQGDDPVTKADTEIDRVLRNMLPEEGEGWLSEETIDNPARLSQRNVWVVDPLDGTREFVSGIPEWCISIGYVTDGEAVAGGVYNPATDELFLGAQGIGVMYNRTPKHANNRTTLEGATVLASRSEIRRGEWEAFRPTGIKIRPMGSIAYKLACIAAGLADATWTLVPKHEWDIAAGVALVKAADGFVVTKQGQPVRFNQTANPKLDGLIAAISGLEVPVRNLLHI